MGIDVGVSRRAALSDGTILPGVELDRRCLVRPQRRLSRARRGSKGRERKRQTVAREWQRLADRERRITHGLSASIVKGYGLVAVEGLPTGNMSRSAAGTVEEPGKNVLAKSGLNRHILEQRWGRMYAQLRYKAASAGIPFVRVDPAHTSQACANCGAIDRYPESDEI